MTITTTTFKHQRERDRGLKLNDYQETPIKCQIYYNVSVYICLLIYTIIHTCQVQTNSNTFKNICMYSCVSEIHICDGWENLRIILFVKTTLFWSNYNRNSINYANGLEPMITYVWGIRLCCNNFPKKNVILFFLILCQFYYFCFYKSHDIIIEMLWFRSHVYSVAK